MPTPDGEGWISIAPPGRDRFTRLHYEFPVEVVAFASVEIVAERAGEVVDCCYSLERDTAGTPLVNASFGSAREGACDRFLTRKGRNHWQSYLTRGFRYLAVVVRAERPVRIRVQAVRWLYPTASTAPFCCDSPVLNRTWEVCEASLKSHAGCAGGQRLAGAGAMAARRGGRRQGGDGPLRGHGTDPKGTPAVRADADARTVPFTVSGPSTSPT